MDKEWICVLSVKLLEVSRYIIIIISSSSSSCCSSSSSSSSSGSSSRSSSGGGGNVFSFYGFVKLLLMQSLHSCFPRAATEQVHICSIAAINNLL